MGRGLYIDLKNSFVMCKNTKFVKNHCKRQWTSTFVRVDHVTTRETSYDPLPRLNTYRGREFLECQVTSSWSTLVINPNLLYTTITTRPFFITTPSQPTDHSPGCAGRQDSKNQGVLRVLYSELTVLHPSKDRNFRPRVKSLFARTMWSRCLIV